ncbi:hypothetical protein [Pseudomonas rustica]
MNMLKQNIVIQAPRLYLAALIVIAIILAISLYLTDPNSDARWISVLSGFVSGLAIASFQFLTQYLEQKALAEYKKHGLVEFLPNRKNPDYYRSLIKNTQVGDKIVVVGVTCNRLLDDFANPKVSNSQDLIEALARGVEVTLLLPKSKYLNKEDKSDFINKTLPKSEEILENHRDKFELRYYDFEPSHSIFLAGNTCLVGPIFKNKKSKDTPAINLDRSGLFTKPYLDYLSEIIDESSTSHE